MRLLCSLRRSAFWSATFTSLTCLIGFGPVEASESRSMTVSYRDLNLSTIEGATVLYQRLRHAATAVCDERGTTAVDSYQVWQACYRAAMADAVRKVNNPLLTALHSGNGKPPVVTAMNRQ
jgi:UrcA family protein